MSTQMPVWTIANQKGGVGKTTTAVTLAGWLALKGQRVLMLDLDPHASLTEYLDLVNAPSAGVAALFAATPPPLTELVLRTAVKGLDVIPASAALATLERQSAGREGWGRAIDRALKNVSGYDVAILDCPPTLGLLMVNALAACDQLIVPTQTEFLALRGLDGMLRTASMVARSRGAALPTLVLATLFDRRTRAGTQSLHELMDRKDADVWDEPMPIDTQFRDAAAAHLPLPQLNPEARGAIAYRRLIERRLWRTEADRAAA